MDHFLNDSDLRYLQTHPSQDQRRLIIPPSFLSALKPHLGPNSLLHTLNTPLSFPLRFPSDIRDAQASYYDRNLLRPFYPRALPLRLDRQFAVNQHAHGACAGCSGPTQTLTSDTDSHSDSEGNDFCHFDPTGDLDIRISKESRAKSKSKSKSRPKAPFNDTDSDADFDKDDFFSPRRDENLFPTDKDLEERLQKLLDKFVDSGFEVGKASSSKVKRNRKGKVPDTDGETKAYVRGYNDAVKDMTRTEANKEPELQSEPETDLSMAGADLSEWNNRYKQINWFHKHRPGYQLPDILDPMALTLLLKSYLPDDLTDSEVQLCDKLVQEAESKYLAILMKINNADIGRQIREELEKKGGANSKQPIHTSQNNEEERAQESSRENNLALEDLRASAVGTLDAARHLDSIDSQAQD